MMNEKCAACIHCEVCGFIESEVAREGACDFYEDGKRWIPVSERLPENSGNYLITYCYEDEIETQEAAYVEGEEEDKWYDITDVEITLAVIAWMPLPEPYTTESEGEE